VHLVGFTIEIYRDARSYKRRICFSCLRCSCDVPYQISTIKTYEPCVFGINKRQNRNVGLRQKP